LLRKYSHFTTPLSPRVLHLLEEASCQIVRRDIHNHGLYHKIIYVPGKSEKNALTTASGKEKKKKEREKPLLYREGERKEYVQ